MAAAPMALRQNAMAIGGTLGVAAMMGPDAATPSTPRVARRMITAPL
jgi:hypothetical protein